MSGGERPMGAAKGTQSDTEALCQPPPLPFPAPCATPPPPRGIAVNSPGLSAWDWLPLCLRIRR